MLPPRTRGNCKGCFKNQVSLAGHQVLHCESAATIRHQGKTRPGFSLKTSQDELHTSRRDASGRLVGIGLQPGDQFIQIICRHRFPCKKKIRKRGKRRDGFEIIQHIVWKGIESAVQHMPAQETEVDCIAIGPRAVNSADTDAPVGASHVFDDNWLPKRVFHALGKDSPDHIRGAARRHWNNHRDRARRIGLSRCEARECRTDCSGPGELQKSAARKFHG